MKSILLKDAVKDLREIKNFIAQDNPQAAFKVISNLKLAVTRLEKSPYIGRPSSDGTREWSVSNLPYVIPYRINEDTIEILRFFHTSLNRPKKWN